MPGINEGKRRRKLAVNKDEWILLKMTRTLSIAFLAFWLAIKKVHRISLVKKLTVWRLIDELENLHKFKFYPSDFLLMIKMSQSAREKLDSYCENRFRVLNHGLSHESIAFSRYTHEPRKYKWQVGCSVVNHGKVLHNYFIPCHSKYSGQYNQCDVHTTYDGKAGLDTGESLFIIFASLP